MTAIAIRIAFLPPLPALSPLKSSAIAARARSIQGLIWLGLPFRLGYRFCFPLRTYWLFLFAVSLLRRSRSYGYWLFRFFCSRDALRSVEDIDQFVFCWAILGTWAF